MPRDHAQINMGIWQDADFRQLPPAAQHLYFTLWTHPGLSYCGVIDWRPGRLAAQSAGWTADDVRRAAACLQARHFLVIDEETEECLVRSWVRWDGLMKQPRLAVSYANAYATVGSNLIRGVLVDELHKLREREPNMPGLSSPKVITMLDQPRVSAKASVSVSDPFGDGFAHRFGDSLGEAAPSVSGSVSVPPTPSPAPSPLLHYSNDAVPASDGKPSAQTLVAEWIDYCGSRPPGRTVGQIAKEVGTMLDEGIPPADVRRGLEEWQRKGLHPSALSSVVHEVRTAHTRPVRKVAGDIDWDAAAARAAAKDAARTA